MTSRELLTKLSTEIRNPAYIFSHSIGRFFALFMPDLKGATMYPPGHFYSPLLKITDLTGGSSAALANDALCWENIDLRRAEQIALYRQLLALPERLRFPAQQSPDHHYYTSNTYFTASDAFLLSAFMRLFSPKRIIEVGSGFSSAVMLDTRDALASATELTFIEPWPERLMGLLNAADRKSSKLLTIPVQNVPLSTFDQLESGDFLFIDSSHIAKIGSDVTHLLLRVLPRLKPGVLIHFHDIFYPHSYPLEWLRRGRAWNESLFLRAFLIFNPAFQIVAFNSYAAASFPEVFTKDFPEFIGNPGASFWIKRVS